MRLVMISLTALSTNAVEIGSPPRRRAVSMDYGSLVPLKVGQQLADMVFQAPDASHAANRCTPRPAHPAANLRRSFPAPLRLNACCDAFMHNGIVDCWSHRKAPQVDRELRSSTRRRANTAMAAPDPAVEEPATAIVEPDDSESVRPSAPHPELDKLIGRFNGLKTMVVDAAAARRLLAINTGNRHISRRRVTQLAAQMRLGHFENTGVWLFFPKALLNLLRQGLGRARACSGQTAMI
jgi:hypothetical protein